MDVKHVCANQIGWHRVRCPKRAVIAPNVNSAAIWTGTDVHRANVCLILISSIKYKIEEDLN